MKRFYLLFSVFFLLNIASAFAQIDLNGPVLLSVFNNATLLPPASVTAIFNQPLHPGIAAGYEFGWIETKTGKLFQDVKLGFYNHRYVYNALTLTTQAGYRKYIGRIAAEASIHAGYLNAFLLTDRVVPQDDGSYKSRKGIGKPQFIAGAGIGIAYCPGHYNYKNAFTLNYDFRLQMPFVKSYVTLLPIGIISLGYRFKIFNF